MFRYLLWAALTLFAPLAVAQAQEAPPNKALHAVFEREFQRALKE